MKEINKHLYFFNGMAIDFLQIVATSFCEKQHSVFSVMHFHNSWPIKVRLITWILFLYFLFSAYYRKITSQMKVESKLRYQLLSKFDFIFHSSIYPFIHFRKHSFFLLMVISESVAFHIIEYQCSAGQL